MDVGNLKRLVKASWILAGLNVLSVLCAYGIVATVEVPEPATDVINELLSDSVNVHYASTVVSMHRSLSDLQWETRVLLILVLVMMVVSIRVWMRASRLAKSITTSEKT